ncbi:Uma2 family endonuclease [Chroococcidiopsis sp. FACHB-1243]|uniref:Uma2 family endonuclease n=1 Tax=Chroococcidiopsis sp. [FACHB-1243] TaxID=2692781 RepID=UPI00177B5490|nr:Uma2 family endonuclease [Chroococcidiopsis sp. [FACHB-1243]]MBD2303992.1 Uma2 family endonuclease [Chroococcidiopsis sp. [FACHB-1243]]
MNAPTLKRFTLAEYHRLAELGFLGEDDRIELIQGQIIKMSAKGTAHEVCITRLLRELPRLLGDRATLRSQSPLILLPDSAPEPDFAIVQNRADDYLSSHPEPADVLLVIEISDSSLRYDQEVKLSLYAEARISEYWIFNLVENHLEVYSEPYHDLQGNFGYGIKRIVLPNRAIALSCFPDLLLDLSKIFAGIGK